MDTDPKTRELTERVMLELRRCGCDVDASSIIRGDPPTDLPFMGSDPLGDAQRSTPLSAAEEMAGYIARRVGAIYAEQVLNKAVTSTSWWRAERDPSAPPRSNDS